MPELPEVETVRRSLSITLLRRRICGVRVARRDVITGDNRRRDLLDGALVVRLERRGKQLAIIADDGRCLCVHLGMSGQLIGVGPRRRLPRTDHVHIQWRLREHDGARPAGRLIFRDPRRFGGVRTYPSFAALRRQRWAELGPDAATVDNAALGSALRRTTRAVKAALLDQSVVAGLGNIYVDEALHMAGIRPERPADRLTEEEIDRLGEQVRALLGRAIEAGGSTLRDYVDSAGRSGWFQLQHAVYGRGGEPCRRCERTLTTALIAQRTTVWCKGCQQ